MKSRKVKAAAKSKAYISKKKLKGNIPLNVESDSGPDIDSDTFYQDDIDDFHKREDEKLSTDDELIHYDDSRSDEEEVLPITDDEKSDEGEEYNDKFESGEEDEEEEANKIDKSEDDEEEDLPNPEGWGRRKSAYYNADFVDEDRGRTYREEDAEAARLEAEGAFSIVKSIYTSHTAAVKYDDALFGTSASEKSIASEESIKNSKLSSKENHMVLKRTYPEALACIQEFKDKISEAKDRLEPLLDLIKCGKVPSEETSNYIKLKYQLLLNYCMNISYYMVLRSSGSITFGHPVMQRIASYKKHLDQLKIIDKKLKSEIDLILEKLKHNEDIELKCAKTDSFDRIDHQESTLIESEQIPMKPSKSMKVKRKHMETEAENEVFSLYMDSKKQQKKDKTAISNDEMDLDLPEPEVNEESEEKRTVTYQIAKNKGLVSHRKKEYRNPRVRHRMKYKKAKIRRKGQVREVIREIKRYEGEPTGISTHVVRSIKIK